MAMRRHLRSNRIAPSRRTELVVCARTARDPMLPDIVHDMRRELHMNHTANPTVAICATAASLTGEKRRVVVMSSCPNH